MKEPLTVFLVDDDEDDKEMFAEVMAEICGFNTCITASNGFEALKLLQSTKTLPDFIFLDLNMPRVNGKQCLVQLKKDERLAPIPVIIYSTSGLESDKEETAQLGADYFFKKPSSIQQLKKELELVLDKKYLSPSYK